ncbi:hypothetical protein J4H86_21295 [Spiractinospora alimapuensis]|uniref:hypothetical protein n=1 Tax=Spiractinospora alimapuensis TaxID=2820884 RepID=UPI001F433026|nr:hypothetical protein [Spiractinospora alimapuensis]QVQ51327.1 hypothetical protein J4H86_21295 [Spiractinospora alimapuensis]
MRTPTQADAARVLMVLLTIHSDAAASPVQWTVRRGELVGQTCAHTGDDAERAVVAAWAEALGVEAHEERSTHASPAWTKVTATTVVDDVAVEVWAMVDREGETADE